MNTQLPTTRDVVRDYISEVFFVDSFEDDASFLEQGIIDSTGMLQLVMFLETTYSFKIEDHELVPENLDSLNKVAAFVHRKSHG